MSRDELLSRADVEEEARLELASGRWGDEGRCTYPQQLPSQHVFLCLTCEAQEGRPAVVCFACSLACHLTHRLLELWRKKNLRCDCGENCQFNSDHLPRPLNADNVYAPAHNFSGLFCWCRQPYDAEKMENVEDVTMLQCVVCTDWFHDKCLAKEDPAKWSFGESGEGQAQKSQDLENAFDEGAFVCRDCSVFVDPYSDTLAYRSDFAEVEFRRPEICPGAPEAPEGFVPRSVFLIPTFQNFLCNCTEKCAKIYGNNLFLEEEEDDEEDEEEEEENAGHIPNLAESIDGAVKAMPHSQQIALAG